MSGETLYEAPRRYNVAKMRVHDYLYDSAFIVSGARDYARTAFKAAMASAQVSIQPVYKSMFSELRQFPRMQVVYHPNCRLPPHVDRSYGAYLERVDRVRSVPTPELAGKDRFKYCTAPKKLCPLKSATPDFQPATPLMTVIPTKPKNRGTQSLYRESSAQTTPWQPNAVAAEDCESTPEVMFLDKLEWGPGNPYRTGDLPADFHTTEIINKMRHARKWSELVEKGGYPRWVKNRDAIITDIETKDWIFREAEIDELQDIRLALLHKMQAQQRRQKTSRTGRKLAKLWTDKKTDMERKIESIRRKRDRELRKLTKTHQSGGRLGLVQDMRAARGGGSATRAAQDPTSDLYAPRARHGYQARRRHAEIVYDPNLLSLEDHEQLSAPPAWLQQCGQNLTRTCSGHHLPRDTTQLCQRETKWSEQFLENLHNDLKKARLGAATTTAGLLRVLKPRRLTETPRPPTPEVEAVPEEDEASHQAALALQKVLRGRAVQNLMFEGRTRAAELTEELKTTHGLQKEDRARIAREEARAREYQAIRSEQEQKEEAISALVEELCGGAVSAALDFLEKELRRLKEERRQHAFILIALREKTMREAAEAGRRQKEEQRRREHDEMFKQVLGVTQETVDAYLRDVTREGVELAAEEQAVSRARASADAVDQSLREHGSMSTAEQNELVAELVQQFLLPEAHKAASRHRVSAIQATKLEKARSIIFGVLDDGVDKEVTFTPALSSVFRDESLTDVCAYNEFSCGDGECVSLDRTCDGNNDCMNGSDEQFCHGDSIPSSSEVLDRSKRQISSCRSNQWQCRDGTCIGFDGKCDGIVDCPDGSDETHPLCRNTQCQSNWFRCTYGACVDGTAPCNGIRECADNSDELLPACRNETNEASVEFKCQDGTTIPAAGHCDGALDCADGSDETVRACAAKQCPSYLFQCAYGACVDQGSDCDGVQQCADGSDESDELCNRIATGTTKPLVTPPTSQSIPNQGGKCVLPPYPERGTYTVGGKPYARPGQSFSSAFLNITCNPGFGVENDRDTLQCYEGVWSETMPKCIRFCRLYKHASIEYHCIISGNVRGTRICGPLEPAGTRVKPVCRLNYYNPDILNYMKCIDGSWDYTAICRPECGTITPEGMKLIINGTNAQRGELPWHAGIYTKKTIPYKQICGGSLISTTIIISAAHCFWDDVNKLLPATDYAVAVGKIFRPWNNPEDVDAQKSDVADIKIPANFQGAAANFQDDIALVLVATPFLYQVFIRPICLDFDVNFDRQQLSDKNLGKVAGWGLVAKNGMASQVLKVAELPFVKIEECISISPQSFREIITSDKICAGYTNGKSLCQGDSGGGLAFPTVERGVTRYYLRGIVSTAPKNEDLCNANALTTFTHIIKHEHFIKEFLLEV